MGYADAVEAARYMGVNTVVGMHYNTFRRYDHRHRSRQNRLRRGQYRPGLLPAMGRH